MKVSSYYKQHGRHGQLVQDLGRGQGVHPLPQDHDKVAGMGWTKLKFEQNFESIVIGLFMMKLYYNKSFKCSHQCLQFYSSRDVCWRERTSNRSSTKLVDELVASIRSVCADQTAAKNKKQYLLWTQNVSGKLKYL